MNDCISNGEYDFYICKTNHDQSKENEKVKYGRGLIAINKYIDDH